MLEHSAEAKRFYNSIAWKKCREAYIAVRVAVDGGMCEHCEEVPGYICDHIVEINSENIDDPHITLNHDNLQYLCTSCHNKKTFIKHKPIREGLTFDEQGNLVEV